MVVDGDVQVLPAGFGAALHAGLEDALANHVEAAQLLGVHVNQFARPRSLVAADRVALGSWQA